MQRGLLRQISLSRSRLRKCIRVGLSLPVLRPSKLLQLRTFFCKDETKETTLERAAFLAGWSELSWSGRAQPV